MKSKSDVRCSLAAVNTLLKHRLQPSFIELGLTLGQGQPRILDSLLTLEGVTQTELADACRLDVTTLSRTIDHMESAGLLARARDPECRRSWRIVLTDDGRRVAERVHEVFSNMDDRLCAVLNREETASLLCTLEKLENCLKECQNS